MTWQNFYSIHSRTQRSKTRLNLFTTYFRLLVFQRCLENSWLLLDKCFFFFYLENRIWEQRESVFTTVYIWTNVSLYFLTNSFLCKYKFKGKWSFSTRLFFYFFCGGKKAYLEAVKYIQKRPQMFINLVIYTSLLSYFHIESDNPWMTSSIYLFLILSLL